MIPLHHVLARLSGERSCSDLLGAELEPLNFQSPPRSTNLFVVDVFGGGVIIDIALLHVHSVLESFFGPPELPSPDSSSGGFR